MSGSSPLSTSSSFKAWKLIYDPDLDKSITSKSEKKTKTKIKRFNGQIPGQSSIKPKDPRLDNPNYGSATSRGKKKYLERLGRVKFNIDESIQKVHKTRLLVSQVDENTTAKDLLDAFSVCGEVICVRLVTASKRFTGLASVKFRHEGEASDALRRMNGFMLGKNRLKVELDVDGSSLQSKMQAIQKGAKSLSEDSKSRHYRRNSLESSDMDISDDDDSEAAKSHLNRVHAKHSQHSGHSTNQPALRPSTPTSTPHPLSQRHGEERTHRLPYANYSDGKHPDYSSHQYYGQQVGTPSRHYPSSSYFPGHGYHYDDPDSKRYTHYDSRESDFYSESDRQGGRGTYSQPDRYSSSSYKSHEYSSSQEQHGRSRYANADNRKYYDDDWRSERRSERWSADSASSSYPDATGRREYRGYAEDDNRHHHRESRYYEGSKNAGHSSSRYDGIGKAPRTPPRPPTDQESRSFRRDESVGKESYYRDSQNFSRKDWIATPVPPYITISSDTLPFDKVEAAQLHHYFKSYEPKKVYHDSKVWYVEFPNSSLARKCLLIMNGQTFHAFTLSMTLVDSDHNSLNVTEKEKEVAVEDTMKRASLILKEELTAAVTKDFDDWLTSALSATIAQLKKERATDLALIVAKSEEQNQIERDEMVENIIPTEKTDEPNQPTRKRFSESPSQSPSKADKRSSIYTSLSPMSSMNIRSMPKFKKGEKIRSVSITSVNPREQPLKNDKSGVSRAESDHENEFSVDKDTKPRKPGKHLKRKIEFSSASLDYSSSSEADSGESSINAPSQSNKRDIGLSYTSSSESEDSSLSQKVLNRSGSRKQTSDTETDDASIRPNKSSNKHIFSNVIAGQSDTETDLEATKVVEKHEVKATKLKKGKKEKKVTKPKAKVTKKVAVKKAKLMTPEPVVVESAEERQSRETSISIGSMGVDMADGISEMVEPEMEESMESKRWQFDLPGVSDVNILTPAVSPTTSIVTIPPDDEELKLEKFVEELDEFELSGIHDDNDDEVVKMLEELVEDEEDLTYLKMVIDQRRIEGSKGYTDNQELEELNQALRGRGRRETHFNPDGTRRESPDRRHRTGCARTEGYYKIPESEKTYLKRSSTLDPSLLSPSQTKIAKAHHNSSSAVPADKSPHKPTSRSSRVNHRRLLAHIQDTKYNIGGDSVLEFNQLQGRQKRLKFAKSGIHDWGLFALERIEKDDFVIEYIGESIRQKVADMREVMYEKQGIGSSYLFRIDEDTIIDATKCGNLARFINHCCDPNCTARIITVDGKKKIVIYAKYDIEQGEEITYDYKFPKEDVKIPCYCGAKACRGSLN